MAIAFTAATAGAATRRAAATSGTRAARVLADVNALRRGRALAPLQVSSGLTAAAHDHSLEMARAGFFGHGTLAGLSIQARLLGYYPAAGYGFWEVGENLAWATPELSAGRMLRLWLRSPEHRANLLLASWREIGIGVVHVGSAPGVFGDLPATIVTVDFGARR